LLATLRAVDVLGLSAEIVGAAHRDGATPIELIDGDTLCDLLRQYDLGVGAPNESRRTSTSPRSLVHDI
jgi:hypothetical protein